MATATAERMPFQAYYLEKPKLVENNPLSKRIEYFRKNWRQEGLPANWADLPGTGFMIERQVDLIFSNLRPEDAQQTRKEKISLGLKQTDQDIKGFILEYLAEGLVFPIHYKISLQGDLVDANYGNKKVVDFVSSEERNGVVKKTLADKIQPFLINARDRSIAIMTSPSGWSGLHQENGEPITFSDSQTYIWQKRGREVLGFTIRTDFSNNEHREMLRRLGKELQTDASVIDYVANPGLIYADDNRNIKNIEDVVGVMRDVRMDMHSGSIFAYKDRMWSEAYRDLDRREELWKFDEVTQEMVQEFKDYVLESELSRENVKEALAVTILRIAKFLRKDSKGPSFTSEESRSLPRHLRGGLTSAAHLGGDSLRQNFSYGEVLTEVQKLPGCAGGGSRNGTSLVNSITPRFGQSGLGIDEEDWFTCPKCGFKADGPVGNKCPGCGLTKEAYAEESREMVCD